MSDDTYNGWTNKESWLIGLWLSNDQGTDEADREVVAENLSDEGKVTMRAANAIEEWVSTFPEVEDVTERASFVSDLLSHALARVDWLEVARSFGPEED